MGNPVPFISLKRSQSRNTSPGKRFDSSTFTISKNSFTVYIFLTSQKENNINNIVISIVSLWIVFHKKIQP